MKFGVHLPQIGDHVGADMVTSAAQQAEALGYDSIWINDHLAIPQDAPYPPAAILEPLITLTWAAAVTKRVALGTSVLVLPLRHPVHMAKEIASLDILSSGRVILGVGVGWLAEEMAALGVPFAERGPRTDDAIKLMRACWTEDPIKTDPSVVGGKTVGMRTLPQPKRPIPIWVGGNSAPALRRAATLGDGWHGLATRLEADEIGRIVTQLRAERGTDFQISLRNFSDALKDSGDDLRRDLDLFAELGIDHVISEPRQRDQAKREKAVEAMWRLCEPYR